MKLFEHPDFDQAIILAAEHFKEDGLRESMIEKDYYVTEILRIINCTAGDKIIFKGGTSLSKGWNIIQRFSEDIDIFLDPTAFQPSLGKNAIDRELKKLKQAIDAHHGIKFTMPGSKTIGGFGRCDYYEYKQQFASVGEIPNRILVEVGTASGKEPIEYVKIQSYLSKFLQKTGRSLGAADEDSFEMKLLHFRRTFVEKLFAIHSKVEEFKRNNKPIGSYARHYYDLYCLSTRPEVLNMLRSQEYSAIKNDYDAVSSIHFKKSYVPPPDMTFAKSDALFPNSDLERGLATEFNNQCQILCFGKVPTWIQVRERFDEIRSIL